VLVSTVRSQPRLSEFMLDYRRTNVSLSRCMQAIVVVGHHGALSSVPPIPAARAARSAALSRGNLLTAVARRCAEDGAVYRLQRGAAVWRQLGATLSQQRVADAPQVPVTPSTPVSSASFDDDEDSYYDNEEEDEDVDDEEDGNGSYIYGDGYAYDGTGDDDEGFTEDEDDGYDGRSASSAGTSPSVSADVTCAPGGRPLPPGFSSVVYRMLRARRDADDCSDGGSDDGGGGWYSRHELHATLSLLFAPWLRTWDRDLASPLRQLACVQLDKPREGAWWVRLRPGARAPRRRSPGARRFDALFPPPCVDDVDDGDLGAAFAAAVRLLLACAHEAGAAGVGGVDGDGWVAGSLLGCAWGCLGWKDALHGRRGPRSLLASLPDVEVQEQRSHACYRLRPMARAAAPAPAPVAAEPAREPVAAPQPARPAAQPARPAAQPLRVASDPPRPTQLTTRPPPPAPPVSAAPAVAVAPAPAVYPTKDLEAEATAQRPMRRRLQRLRDDADDYGGDVECPTPGDGVSVRQSLHLIAIVAAFVFTFSILANLGAAVSLWKVSERL
jgi:hypothetical protein